MRKLFLIGILVLAILLVGCSPKSTTGTVVLQLTDAPADYEKVEVTISKVMVHYAGTEGNDTDENATTNWFTIVEGAQTFDLIAIQDVNAFLGSAVLEAGKYTQVRLSVDSAKATINGTAYTLDIPSKEVKLIKGFDIEANKTTTLTLDFSANDSIHETGNSNYIMRPTIKIVQE